MNGGESVFEGVKSIFAFISKLIGYILLHQVEERINYLAKVLDEPLVKPYDDPRLTVNRQICVLSSGNPL